MGVKPGKCLLNKQVNEFLKNLTIFDIMLILINSNHNRQKSKTCYYVNRELEGWQAVQSYNTPVTRKIVLGR